MSKAIIKIQTEPEIKQATQALADNLGLTLNELINVQLRQLLNTRQLILDASSWPTMKIGPKTEKLLDKAHKEVAKGQVSQAFDNTKDLFKDLGV